MYSEPIPWRSLEMAGKIDNDFERVKKSKSFDAYYIPTRYPNGLPGGVPSRFYDDPVEAENAELMAKGVIQLVDEKIPIDNWHSIVKLMSLPDSAIHPSGRF